MNIRLLMLLLALGLSISLSGCGSAANGEEVVEKDEDKEVLQRSRAVAVLTEVCACVH